MNIVRSAAFALVLLGLSGASLRSVRAASEPDEAVSAGRETLRSSGRAPWYDPATDDVRLLRIDPPKNPPPVSTTTSTSTAVAGDAWGLWSWIVFVLLAAVLIALAAMLFWSFLEGGAGISTAEATDERTSTEPDRIEHLPFTVAKPKGDLLAEARRLYLAGDYNGAIIYLYSYELVQLDRHQIIELTKGKTNRQYLRETRSRMDLKPLLERTMLAFEDVFFGHHTLQREQFEFCWQATGAFESLTGVTT